MPEKKNHLSSDQAAEEFDRIFGEFLEEIANVKASREDYDAAVRDFIQRLQADLPQEG